MEDVLFDTKDWTREPNLFLLFFQSRDISRFGMTISRIPSVAAF